MEFQQLSLARFTLSFVMKDITFAGTSWKKDKLQHG